MAKTWRAFAAAALISLGLLFRFWNLAAQILSDDEIHTVRAALRRPVSEILVTYQLVDSCIPLSALFRSCLDAGLRLSEMAFRLPSVIAGALLLLAVPGWAARRLGGGPAIVLAGLLAVSPGLVFYSRIARPYALVVLLGFGAVAAFDAWWRRPSWRWGMAYAGLAALAVWFHLGAAPLVVSPLLFGGTASLIRRDRGRLLAVAGLATATALGFLAFLIPARESLQRLVLAKSGRAMVSPAAALDVLQLLAGSARPAVVLLVWIAAAAGFVRLLRLDRDLALLTASVVFGHVAGLLILAPQGQEVALIFHRYLLVALPWALLWMAVALGHPWPTGRKAQPTVAVLLLALLLGTGPLLDARLLRSSFAQHNDYLGFHAPPPALRRRQIPRFYRRLAWSPEAGPVLEYPWIPVWRVNRSFYLYQEIHGQDVVVASIRPVLADRRLAFRNMAPGNPEGFLASRARYLVIHRRLGMEEERLPEAGSYPQPQVLGRFERLFHNAGRSMIGRLRRKWGPPDYSDRWIAVWDLERVRGGAPGRAGGEGSTGILRRDGKFFPWIGYLADARDLPFGKKGPEPAPCAAPALRCTAPVLGYSAPALGYSALVLGCTAPVLAYSGPGLGYSAPALPYTASALGCTAPALRAQPLARGFLVPQLPKPAGSPSDRPGSLKPPRT